MTRNSTIILVGFSGSGKSTIGAYLAKRLKADFLDIDAVIEKEMGMTVREIFRELGERKFRALETQTMSKILRRGGRRKVVALGGGALLSAANRILVSGAGTVVYLSCSQRELYRRLAPMKDRPLLHGGDRHRQSGAQMMRTRIRQLMGVRMKQYRRADITVSTTRRSIAETAAEIIKKLELHRENN